MPTYTIIDSDFLNSAILPDEPDQFAAYTTKTTTSLNGPKATAFIPSVNDKNDSLLGEINWKEGTFSIGGVAVRWDDLKSKPNGVKDRLIDLIATPRKLLIYDPSTREWSWVGKKYWVKYDHNVWVASVRPANSNGIRLNQATFTIRKPRVLHHSRPANIVFTPEVSPKDRVFLLLVFIFCEKKRQDRKEKAALALAASHWAKAETVRVGLGGPPRR